MRPLQYILDAELREVPCSDLLRWATWMGDANRHVAEDWIGPYRVSTVFLGVDHNYSIAGTALLYETMIFREVDKNRMQAIALVERYHTWTEAQAGHADAFEKVKAGLLP